MGRVLTLSELAERCGGTAEGNGSLQITGPAGLSDAGPSEVSFLAQAGYASQLATTQAGVVLVGTDVQVDRPGLALIRCEDPERAFTQVILAFAPEIPRIPEGVHPGAFLHQEAEVADGVAIAERVSVGPGAVIESGAMLHAGVTVGAGARVGRDSVLHPGVVVYPHSEVGQRCIVHACTVIGSEGFGFHHDGTSWKKTPQAGRAVLEDDVEIGAGSAIDCARFGATRIGAGTKLDNLVHVGHNVQVGRNCLLLAHVGVAGSTVIEDNVILAGRVGVTGHVRIGKGARVAGGSGVTKSVPAGEEWFGYPAGPSREKLRGIVSAERAGNDLRALKKEVKGLRAELQALREAVGPDRLSSQPSNPSDPTGDPR